MFFFINETIYIFGYNKHYQISKIKLCAMKTFFKEINSFLCHKGTTMVKRYKIKKTFFFCCIFFFFFMTFVAKHWTLGANIYKTMCPNNPKLWQFIFNFKRLLYYHFSRILKNDDHFKWLIKFWISACSSLLFFNFTNVFYQAKITKVKMWYNVIQKRNVSLFGKTDI